MSTGHYERRFVDHELWIRLTGFHSGEEALKDGFQVRWVEDIEPVAQCIKDLENERDLTVKDNNNSDPEVNLYAEGWVEAMDFCLESIDLNVKPIDPKNAEIDEQAIRKNERHKIADQVRAYTYHSECCAVAPGFAFLIDNDN